MRHIHWLMNALILLPTLAWASTLIIVDPADSPLKITGWLAEEQLSGSLEPAIRQPFGG